MLKRATVGAAEVHTLPTLTHNEANIYFLPLLLCHSAHN